MRVAFCLLLLVWLGIRQKPRIFQKKNCWEKRVWEGHRERRSESFWVSSVWGSYSWETSVEFFLHVCCLQEFILPFEALWGVKAPQTHNSSSNNSAFASQGWASCEDEVQSDLEETSQVSQWVTPKLSKGLLPISHTPHPQSSRHEDDDWSEPKKNMQQRNANARYKKTHTQTSLCLWQ